MDWYRLTGDTVADILIKACVKNIRLKLRRSDDHFYFFSRFLEIGQEQILLAEITPAFSGNELLVDSRIDLLFPMYSEEYFCAGSVFYGLKRDTSTLPEYMIARPESLYRLMRRRVRRIKPDDAFPVRVVAIGNRSVSGTVLVDNIGSEGARLSFPSRVTPIEPGLLLQGIKLKLHGSIYITVDGMVRHHFMDERGRFCVGLAWEPMSRSTFQSLATFLTLAVEREERLSLAPKEADAPVLFNFAPPDASKDGK